MVYAADSSCISDVICNGRILMRNRKVPGEEQIIADAHKLAVRIKILNPFPTRFPKTKAKGRNNFRPLA